MILEKQTTNVICEIELAGRAFGRFTRGAGQNERVEGLFID